MSELLPLLRVIEVEYLSCLRFLVLTSRINFFRLHRQGQESSAVNVYYMLQPAGSREDQQWNKINKELRTNTILMNSREAMESLRVEHVVDQGQSSTSVKGGHGGRLCGDKDEGAADGNLPAVTSHSDGSFSVHSTALSSLPTVTYTTMTGTTPNPTEDHRVGCTQHNCNDIATITDTLMDVNTHAPASQHENGGDDDDNMVDLTGSDGETEHDSNAAPIICKTPATAIATAGNSIPPPATDSALPPPNPFCPDAEKPSLWFEFSSHTGRMHLHSSPDGSQPMGLAILPDYDDEVLRVPDHLRGMVKRAMMEYRSLKRRHQRVLQFNRGVVALPLCDALEVVMKNGGSRRRYIPVAEMLTPKGFSDEHRVVMLRSYRGEQRTVEQPIHKETRKALCLRCGESCPFQGEYRKTFQVFK